MLVILVAAAFAICGVLWAAGGSRRPLRKAAGSVGSGLLALLAVELSSGLTGVTLSICPLTVGVAALLGVPGVASLLLLDVFFI